MSEKKRVLFFNPTETGQPQYREKKAGEIWEELQRTQQQDDFEFKQQRADRIGDLRRSMFEYKPRIVHFSGQGTNDGLFLKDEAGQMKAVPTAALSSFFRLFANQVECVLLNAGYSKAQAEAVGEHIKYVIGIRQEIGDEAAISFSVAFYQALGAGFSVEEAFESGRSAIETRNIPEHLTPLLHVRKSRKAFAADSPQPSIASGEPIKIFYSYAHEDEKLRKKIETSLVALQRQKLIESWSDRQIPPGEEWGEQIDSRLNAAQIILLLVSDDFINSNYCYNVEMERAMERHEKGEACVIPIILRDCLWQKLPFAKLQALPRDAKAITSWTKRDEAFYNVALGIEAVIEGIRKY